MGSVMSGQRGGAALRRALSGGLTILLTAGIVTISAGPASADPAATSIDASPSGPVVVGASGYDATWTITADATECSLLSVPDDNMVAGPSACQTGDVSFPISDPGSYQLQVIDPATATPVLSPELDANPAAPVITGPTSPYNDPAPSWTFDARGDATVACTLSYAGTTVQSDPNCTSPFDAADLTTSSTNGTPGDYTLTVTQTVAGRTSDAATSTYDFETATPATPAVSADADQGHDRHPTFTVTGLVDGATPTCTVTPSAGASVEACGGTAKLDLGSADDGSYTLHVSQTFAGNAGAEAAASYLLDTIAPGEPSISAAAGFGAGDTPSFTVTGVDPDAHVADCTVTGPSTVTVGSCDTSISLDLSSADPGTYTVTVDAADDAGNTSATDSASYEYLPAAPPAPEVSAPSATGNDTMPVFSISDTEPVTLTYDCTLSGPSIADQAVVPCGTSTPVDLSAMDNGDYTLTVTATDRLGQPSPAASATYHLDTKTPAPDVSLLTPAASPGTDPSPTFTISDTEAGDTFSCVWQAPDGTTLSSGPCADGDEFATAGNGDGTYQLTVTATDALGNVKAAAGVGYVLEAAAPPAPSVTAVGGDTGNATSVDFSITDAENVPDLTFACTLSGGSFVDAPVTPCDATTTVDLGSEAGGTFTLSVTATDGFGHTSPAGTGSYTLDRVAQAPTVSLAAPLLSPSTNPSPAFVITPNELVGAPDTFSCTWSGPGIAVPVTGACASGDSFTATGEGVYTLSVTATDADDNTSPPATATYSYDAVPPGPPTVTALDPVGSVGTDPTPSFTLTDPGDSSPGGLTYTCVATNTTTDVVVDAADISCDATTTLDLTATGDGVYDLQVTAVDAAGNVGSSAGSASYTLDRTAQPPTVTRTSPTASPAATDTATFAISSNELLGQPDTFSCIWSGPGITSPTPATCADGDAFTAPGDGDYTLSVTATDTLGTTSTPATATYTRDASAQAPTVTLTSPSPGSSASPAFEIDDNELLDGPDSFACTWSGPGLPSPTPTVCHDGDSFFTPGDGVYTLSVTATDALGNVSDPASATYTRDSVAQAPTVSLATPSTALGNDPAPTFTIGDNEAADGPDDFSCTWSGPGITTPTAVPCASGDSFATVDDGDYTLSVTASDTLHNVSPPATADYTYDGTAPAAPVVTRTAPAASPGTAATATFKVTSPGDTSPGGVHYDCTVTNDTAGTTVAAADVTCGATTTVNLAATGDGAYTVSVTATDAAGNVGSPGTATYTLDTVAQAPTVSLATPAGSPGTSASPTFTITSTELVGLPDHFTCTWSGGSITNPVSAPCLSGQGFPANRDGDYTLSVTATDLLGNVSPATTATYTRDTVAQAPTVLLASPNGSPATAMSPTFSITPNELVGGPDTFLCTWSGPGLPAPTPTACADGDSFFAGSDGDYTLTVTATDSLNNVSPAATATYIRDTVAQAPTVSLATPASSPGSDQAPTFSISSTELVDGPASFSCTWSGPGISSPAAAPCASGDSFPATEDGDYTLSVVAIDTLGNPSAAVEATYTLDATAPGTPMATLATPASSPNHDTNPTFSVSNAGDSSPGGLVYHCVVTNNTTAAVVAASNVTCGPTTSVDLGPTGDGDYTLAVSATDAAGNGSASAGSATYTLDATAPAAPEVTLTSPAATPGTSTAPTFTVTTPGDGSPGGLTYACAVTYLPTPAGSPLTLPADKIDCGPTTTLDLSGTGDAVYTLSVTSTDLAGNASIAAGTADYALDDSVPETPTVTLTTPVSSPGHVTSPQFTVTNPGDASPGGLVYSCTATKTAPAPAAPVPAADVSCGSATVLDVGSLGDGDYSLSVTATDAAGNTSPVAGTATYTLDATVPAAPVVTRLTPVASPATDANPTFSVASPGDTSPGGLAYACTVTGPTTVPATAVSCGATTSVDLSGAGRDGAYTLSVVATDAAGNAGPAGSATYDLDTTAPNAPTVTLRSPPSSPGHNTTPSFTVSNPGDASPGGVLYSCSVTETSVTPPLAVGASKVSCGPTTTVDLTGGGKDGTYRLDVTATDLAGNVSASAGSATYTLDTVAPPAPAVSVPAPATRQPAFGISDGDPTASLTCVLVAPNNATVFGPAGCPANGTFDTSSFTDGVYSLTVTATDPAGNQASTSVTWTRDTTPPLAPTVSAPASPSNDTTPTFAIADTDPSALLSCTLAGPDGAGTAFSGTCPSNGTFPTSGDGVYTLTVVAADAAGNVQATTASASYTLDATAPLSPAVTRTSPATSPGNTTRVQFAVSETDSSPGGTTLQCAVTGPSTVAPTAISCGAATTVDLSGASDGVYTLSVTATDAAGNTSSAAGTASYELDTTPPPAPTITLAHPGSPGNSTSPTFTLTDADTSAMTYTCSVTGPTAVPATAVVCGSTATVDLSGSGRDGEYTLSATATDAAGNSSAGPGTARYVLDTTPPGAPIVKLATATRSNTTTPLWTWEFGPNDPTPEQDTGTCVVNGPNGWTSTTRDCSQHFRTELTGGDGHYTLTVTVSDAAGNTAANSESPTYRLDSTAPTGAQVTNDNPASGIGHTRHPSWNVDGPASSTFRCTLIAGGAHGDRVAPETTCTDPVSYSLAGRPDGQYTLKVVAVDAVGNRAFPAYGSYILVPSAPRVSAPRGTGSLAVWSVAGNTADRWECTLLRSGAVAVAAHSCGAHPTYDMSRRPAGDYTLSVVQIGAADTRSPAGTATWHWSGQATNNGNPGGGPVTRDGGAGGKHHGGPGGPAGLPGLVRHQIHQLVHTAGRTAGSHFPGLPHPSGVGSGVVSAVQNVVHTIGAAGGGTGFPLLLVGLVLVFLIAQNRIDRRDPKLALASIAADDMVEFHAPPSRRERQ